MKKLYIAVTMAFFLLFFSCGDSSKEVTKAPEKIKKARKSKKKKSKITVEKYCSVNKELKALLMEKYWSKFKGKEYKEIKGIYNDYLNDEKKIYAKYDIKKPLRLSSFFRTHFKEVEAYNSKDPDYKKYEEYPKAKRHIISYAMKKAYGD